MRFCLWVVAVAVLFASPGSAQIDVDGLQSSLKTGGVEGLNRMLQAMAAVGGAHGGDGASAHLTKDASGNAMYDFRDISGAPKPETLAQAAPASALKKAPEATAEVAKAPSVQQVAAQASPSASSQADDDPPMPDFGIIEPAKTQRPRPALRSLVSAKVAATAAVAPPDQDDDSDEMTASPAEQSSNLIVWPPEPPTAAAPQVQVHKVVPELVPPVAAVAQAQSSTSTDEETAAVLAQGLGSMRKSLDTLLAEARGMLHARRQLVTPAPMVATASASIASTGSAAGAKILERLQAIEDDNAKMKKQEMAQALRLMHAEDKEQQEGSELKKLAHENEEMRDQIKASQSASFLQDKRAPGGQIKWEIRTFFHKKAKIHRQ